MLAVNVAVVGAVKDSSAKSSLEKAVKRAKRYKSLTMTISGGESHSGLGDRFVYQAPDRELYRPALDSSFPSYVTIGKVVYIETGLGRYRKIERKENQSLATIGILNVILEAEEVVRNGSDPKNAEYKFVLAFGSGQFGGSRRETGRVVVKRGLIERVVFSGIDRGERREVIFDITDYGTAPPVVPPREL